MQKTFNFFYAFLLAILGFGATLMAEDITLTTYYPAPYGAYDELSTTGATNLATTSGNVGIGTTSGGAKFDVAGTIRAKDVFAAGGQNLIIGDEIFLSDLDTANTLGIYGVQNTTIGNIKLGSGGPTIYGAGGMMGIGVSPTTSTLEVNGNIRAIFASVGGGTTLKSTAVPTGVIGYDIAELFDASEEIEAGDVVGIDETKDLKLRKSSAPYETGMVGITSGGPAILFEGSQIQIAPKPGEFIKGTKIPIALAGRVTCKVSLENGAIKRGDLLTASSIPGHAMKATNREKSFGAIIGKALENFNGGSNGEKQGRIIVLVTLQ